MKNVDRRIVKALFL